MAQILDGVSACQGAKRGDHDGDSDRKIWIAMALFDKGRAAVQQRLQKLRKMGCNVRLVIGRKVKRGFAGAGLKASNVRRRTVHHKFMLIDAKYEGQWREVVFTGSHNFTGRALHDNDEIWLRVENPFVFHAYRHHFDGLFGKP